MADSNYTWAVGRRKCAVARVRTRPGTGTVLVNGEELDAYFPNPQWRNAAIRPLEVLEMDGKFDVHVNCTGGGKTGQAEAMALGLARALTAIDAEANQATLRAEGLLTRDPRMVERKKYGLRGARRAFQFSKR